MAIVKLNPLIAEAYGKMGALVFKRGPNGQTIVSKIPRQSPGKVKKYARSRRNARWKPISGTRPCWITWN
jgi:hypothetical protein